MEFLEFRSNVCSNAVLILGRPMMPRPSPFNKKKMSISIFGLDSTARAHFHRSMPKTVKQMQKMGFLTFHGYNKVLTMSVDGSEPFADLRPVKRHILDLPIVEV